jgi:hypothetical protein
MHDWPAGARKVVRSYDPARDPDYIDEGWFTKLDEYGLRLLKDTLDQGLTYL